MNIRISTSCCVILMALGHSVGCGQQMLTVDKKGWLLSSPNTPLMFFATVALAILVAIFFFFWNYMLRRKVVRQTTELAHSQQALVTSEAKYRSILKNIEGGYYELDIAGNIAFCNDSLHKILKTADSKLTGKSILSYVGEKSTDKIIDDLDQVRHTGRPASALIWKVRRADGSNCILEASVGLITDTNDRITGFRGIVRDVTDKHLFEQQRRSLEEQLRQAEKMEAIGTLAGGLSHDFNNLMMTMLGNISLMLREADPSQPNYKRLKAVEKQIQTGTELVGQLLGYARKGAYEILPVDLNRIVRHRIKDFSSSHRDIHLNVNLADDLYAVEADARQLEHVVLNLLANAADAMPAGGNLNIRSRNLPGTDSQNDRPDAAAPNRVQLILTDTGTGIKAEIIDRIFDPFFTTKEMERGTGLGLASAYGIIKNHNGHITVKSEKGEGTTFNILLPAIDMRAVSVKPESGGYHLHRGLVLLVDDEEMVIEIGAQMLEKLGFQVICARDGHKAVDIF